MLDKGHSLDENQNKWWIKIVTGCSDNVVSFKHLHLFKNPYKSSNLHHLHLLRIEIRGGASPVRSRYIDSVKSKNNNIYINFNNLELYPPVSPSQKNLLVNLGWKVFPY